MDKPSFEQSFERLEKILEKMNAGKVPLDESLKLFEEAQKLLQQCNRQLINAEQKIELLVKGKHGELLQNLDGTPQTKMIGEDAPERISDQLPF